MVESIRSNRQIMDKMFNSGYGDSMVIAIRFMVTMQAAEVKDGKYVYQKFWDNLKLISYDHNKNNSMEEYIEYIRSDGGWGDEFVLHLFQHTFEHGFFLWPVGGNTAANNEYVPKPFCTEEQSEQAFNIAFFPQHYLLVYREETDV